MKKKNREATMASYSDFKSQSRLPKFASPKRYDLRLKPDLTTCKFEGVVSIDVDVVSPTKHLVLNAADLNVDSSSVSFKPKSTSKVIIIILLQSDFFSFFL